MGCLYIFACEARSVCIVTLLSLLSSIKAIGVIMLLVCFCYSLTSVMVLNGHSRKLFAHWSSAVWLAVRLLPVGLQA